jgi:hypothetical protein
VLTPSQPVLAGRHEPPWSEPRRKTVSSSAGLDEGMENVRQEPHRRGSFRIVIGKRDGELEHRILIVS